MKLLFGGLPATNQHCIIPFLSTAEVDRDRLGSETVHVQLFVVDHLNSQ